MVILVELTTLKLFNDSKIFKSSIYLKKKRSLYYIFESRSELSVFHMILDPINIKHLWLTVRLWEKKTNEFFFNSSKTIWNIKKYSLSNLLWFSFSCFFLVKIFSPGNPGVPLNNWNEWPKKVIIEVWIWINKHW